MHLFCCLICLFVFSIVLFLLWIVFLGFAQIFYLRLIQTCSSLHHLLTWHSKSLRSGSSFHLLVLSLHKCRFVAGAAWTGAGWPSSQPARGAILAHPLLNLDGAWAADVQLMLLTEISTFSLLRMGFPQLIIIWGSLQNPVGFPLPCLLPATRSLLLPHPCQTGRSYPAVAKPRGKCFVSTDLFTSSGIPSEIVYSKAHAVSFLLLCVSVGEGYCGFPLRAEKGSTGNLGTHWFLALLEKHWRILLQVGVGSQDLSWPESRIRAVGENDLLLNCVFSFQLASAQMTIFYFLFFLRPDCSQPKWAIHSPVSPLHCTGQRA